MKKTQNKVGKHTGYELNNLISIHDYMGDDENWYLTIRILHIYGEVLCKKTCSEKEIARYINIVLHKRLNVLNDAIASVSKFT